MPYVDGFIVPVPKKKRPGLPAHGEEGGKDLARASPTT